MPIIGRQTASFFLKWYYFNMPEYALLKLIENLK